MSNRVISEFKEFLYKYKVIGLAVAFIIGTAASVLINAFVKDVLMPIITPFIPGGEWQKATFNMGPIVISWGDLLAAVLNFVIIAFAVFMIARWVLKEKKVTKK